MTELRIAISANSSWNVCNFRGNLIRELLAHGFEVIVVAPRDGHSWRLEALGCSFTPIPMDRGGTNPWADFLLFLRYIQTFKRVKPHLFIGYTIKPNIIGSLAARCLRISVINNISGLGTAFIQGGWLAALAEWGYAVALRHSKAVFFQNPDDRQLFVAKRLVRSEQSVLIPGSGIDLASFLPETPCISTTFTFLLVGRLLWDKGIGEYIKAAQRVRNIRSNVRFQLLGPLDVDNRTAIDLQTLQRWAEEGVVEYLGHTDDVRPFIENADCIVLPSYREGTPRVLLEAAAMGRPVIATDVPGCRQVVDNGITGFLCRVRDQGDLACKMLMMLDLAPRDREAMGRAGREKVEREFDERIVFDRYLKAIYSDLRHGPQTQQRSSRSFPRREGSRS
jgi:glycosyltransferase involved in cell wall biosynthesis